eukprot:SAG22_NODE_10998_length_505_cov_6.233444_1_plen_65_part_10
MISLHEPEPRLGDTDGPDVAAGRSDGAERLSPGAPRTGRPKKYRLRFPPSAAMSSSTGQQQQQQQ